MPPAASIPPVRLRLLTFDDLVGWTADDHAAAFAAFRLSAASPRPPKRREIGVDPDALAAVLDSAAGFAGPPRQFFETGFRPVAVESADSLFTGYYEPELAGSRQRTDIFTVPLYRQPDDLVPVAGPATGLDPALEWARTSDRGLVPFFDRGEIEAGALAGRGLELVWLADPVDAFFIHVQGAARIHLIDGTAMRVSFAAKSGHPYTSIGKVLVAAGAIATDAVDMAAIRAWLAAHPAQAPGILRQNRSFIFFQETAIGDAGLGPVAAAGVQLSPGRSLAVDRRLYPFHLPVFIETELPVDGIAFNRLMIAQDTGSAIVGPARADIFFGTGDAVGALAGAMQAAGRFVMLVPRGDPLLERL